MYIYIYQIAASCTKHLILLYPIFLFRQRREEWMREKYFHFQHPISFNFFHIVLNFHIVLKI